LESRKHLPGHNSGVAFTGLRDLDDLLGNPLGYRIGSVGKSDDLQAMLIRCNHPVNVILIERRMLQ
jgi:hypothetical protein